MWVHTMKKWFAVLIVLVILAGSMPGLAETKFSRNIFGYFDTVITLMGYTNSQAEFD